MLKQLYLTATGLIVAAVLVQPTPLFAAERDGEEVKVEAKKEAHDAMATGTKGVSEGKIVSKGNGKITVATKEGNLLFMAHWRGGMPKDGGGLEKAMVEKLGTYKVGDQVKINWIWEERRRVEQIERVHGKE